MLLHKDKDLSTIGFSFTSLSLMTNVNITLNTENQDTNKTSQTYK